VDVLKKRMSKGCEGSCERERSLMNFGVILGRKWCKSLQFEVHLKINEVVEVLDMRVPEEAEGSRESGTLHTCHLQVTFNPTSHIPLTSEIRG